MFSLQKPTLHLAQICTTDSDGNMDMLFRPLICSGGAEPWQAQLGASE